MSASMSLATAPALIDEVRDVLAHPFADWIAERTPDALELLEAQLAGAADREQWNALRAAIDLLGASGATLGPAVARHVAKRFDAKLERGDDPFGRTARFSLDTMSLVGDDQVREEIAIGNCAKRLREQLGEELFTLTQRLASILHVDSLPDDRNPVFPRIFARGLYDALSAMEPDLSTRLAAFAAFGPVMLDAIREVYLRANRVLISHGVLPNFKRTFGAPRQRASHGSQPAMPPANPVHIAATSPARPVAIAAPGMVTIQVRPELVLALRGLEARLRATPERDPAGWAAMHPASLEIHRARRAMADTLSPSDAIVTDVVAALFDRLFADRRLPDAAKAQVGRLQLPVLKAILKDHSFFNEPAHPIRHVIDTIAELGACDPAILVDDCTPEEWIAASVQNLVEGADDDPQVWTRECERLAGALERHHEASLASDPEVLALREQERALAALREATLAIVHRAEAAHVSQDATSFLYRRWRDVMVHDYLEYGEGSEEWGQDLRVVEDLLWVLEPRGSAEERSRLAALLPSLIFRMKLGFVRADVDGHVSVERIEALRTMLDEVVSAPAPRPHARSVDAVPADDYTATLHTSSEPGEGFGRGSWFEFIEPDGSSRRCRLTWMSPVQGACVFKDLGCNRSFAMGLAELRERRRAGSAIAVEGPGVAAASVEAALDDVACAFDAQDPILPRPRN